VKAKKEGVEESKKEVRKKQRKAGWWKERRDGRANKGLRERKEWTKENV